MGTNLVDGRRANAIDELVINALILYFEIVDVHSLYCIWLLLVVKLFIYRFLKFIILFIECLNC